MPIQIDVSKAQKKQDANVQYIPCDIEFSGQAEIDKNFTLNVSETTEKENGMGMDGRLRGHPLKGSTMKTPKGYTGVVLKETQVSMGKGAQVMKGLSLFDNFTYWNWDREPSRSDKYQQALDWIEVASVIHGTEN